MINQQREKEIVASIEAVEKLIEDHSAELENLKKALTDQRSSLQSAILANKSTSTLETEITKLRERINGTIGALEELAGRKAALQAELKSERREQALQKAAILDDEIQQHVGAICDGVEKMQADIADLEGEIKEYLRASNATNRPSELQGRNYPLIATIGDMGRDLKKYARILRGHLEE